MSPLITFFIILLVVIVLPEFLKQKKINNSVPVTQIILATLLLLSFFFPPWINANLFLNDFSVKGYEFPTKLKAFYNFRDSSDGDTVILFSYSLYLIPTFSIATIIFGACRRDMDAFFVSRFASLVPILLGAFVVAANNDVLKYFDIGFYLTIVFGFCLWISTLFSTASNKDVLISNSKTDIQNTDTAKLYENEETKSDSIISEKNDLLNQLSQLYNLKENKVITEEIYERQRQTIIAKLQQSDDLNKEQPEEKENGIKEIELESAIDQEEHDPTQNELLTTKNWFQRNRKLSILLYGLIIIIIGSIFAITKRDAYWNSKDAYRNSKNDWYEMNLNAKVKSIKESTYEAVEKDGKVQKGEKITESIIILFNDLGNKLETNCYNSDGSIRSKEIYRYDGQEKKIEENEYKEDGSLNVKYNYKYYNEKTEKYFYYSDGNLEAKTIYKYDEKGNKIEETSYSSNGNFNGQYTYKYDETGNQIERNEYSADGSYTGKQTYRYDTNKNVIEEQSDYGEGSEMSWHNTYKYDYDKNSNWIIKTAFEDNKPILIVERIIEYF